MSLNVTLPISNAVCESMLRGVCSGFVDDLASRIKSALLPQSSQNSTEQIGLAILKSMNLQEVSITSKFYSQLSNPLSSKKRVLESYTFSNTFPNWQEANLAEAPLDDPDEFRVFLEEGIELSKSLVLDKDEQEKFNALKSLIDKNNIKSVNMLEHVLKDFRDLRELGAIAQLTKLCSDFSSDFNAQDKNKKLLSQGLKSCSINLVKYPDPTPENKDEL